MQIGETGCAQGIFRKGLRPARIAATAVLALLLAACGGGASSSVSQDDADWPSYANSNEQHYSALDQINDGNLDELGLAWSYDINVGGSSLSAPVAVDGVLYFVAGYSVVHAVDAATGKLLWQYDPEAWQVAGPRMRSAWGSRGLAYAGGRIFVGTVDGRLIAIDAKSGEPVWSKQTLEEGSPAYITGAPWVFKDKVVIGNGGADFGGVRGFVTAYDQASGDQAWRFYTVPGNPADGFENEAMAKAAETWTGDWWKYGGGGTVWNAFAYDEEFDRIYIGVGNGAPWNRKIRSPDGGDNLYLASIVAVDADTGEYDWHYQVNPGETWDFSAAMDMLLAEIEIEGKPRKVLMQAPKNGFFYVIDREDGSLISAEPFVKTTWASRIDRTTGRPVENEDARYPDGKPGLVFPSGSGAHNIEAMSFSPLTGLSYIPALDKGEYYIDPPGDLNDWDFAGDQQVSVGLGGFTAATTPSEPVSYLIGWNPVSQESVWKHELPGVRSFGGTAVTGGNLLIAGDVTGQLAIYKADDGTKLWSFDAQTAVTAQPITYMAGGKQYISVIAGARQYNSASAPKIHDYRSQSWRVLTFALGGKAVLPAQVEANEQPIVDADFEVVPAKAQAGAVTFAVRCLQCHGVNAVAGGAAPSLTASGVVLDLAALHSVVVEGALKQNGMPDFPKLTDEQLVELQHYIRAQAASEAPISGGGARGP